ncbi:MAG: hypothetical protein HQL81_08600 [Magnetococcales bacterium]|nr:hypothetical protein [Magnetococcales bacterium]
MEKIEPTWLAMVESLLAVACYGWFAWYFQTDVHLLVSVCVAPLLLLRSKESTAKGVEWFDRFWKNEQPFGAFNNPFFFWVIFSLVVAITAVCIYLLAQSLTLEFLTLFIRIIIIIFISSLFGFLVTFAIVGAVAELERVAIAITVAGAVAGAVAGVSVEGGVGVAAVAGAVAGGVALAVAGMDAMVLTVMLTVVGAGVAVVKGARVTAVVTGAFAGAGAAATAVMGSAALGVWLRSIGIRFIATLRHPWFGIQSLPDNWHRTLLAIDLYHAPELVPGLEERNHESSTLSLIKKLKNTFFFIAFFYILFSMIFIVPAILYRWSLKSTCWLYLPIINFTQRPEWVDGSQREGPGTLLCLLHHGAVEKLRRFIAVLVLLSTAFFTLDLSQYFALKDHFPASPILVQMWGFNLTQLHPWQWLGLVAALATLFIFIQSDKAMLRWKRIKKLNGEKADPSPTDLKWLWRLTQLRNISSFFWILLSVGYVLFHA